jgi:hypothetical protein
LNQNTDLKETKAKPEQSNSQNPRFWNLLHETYRQIRDLGLGLQMDAKVSDNF